MDIKEVAKLLGSEGGKATARLHGKEHFSKAGKLGAATRWNSKRLLSQAQSSNSKRLPIKDNKNMNGMDEMIRRLKLRKRIK